MEEADLPKLIWFSIPGGVVESYLGLLHGNQKCAVLTADLDDEDGL